MKRGVNDHKREDNYTLWKSYICECKKIISCRGCAFGPGGLQFLFYAWTLLELGTSVSGVGRGYLPLHLVILAPIFCLMPQLPWSMAWVTPLMAQCQNQHICRSRGVRVLTLLHCGRHFLALWQAWVSKDWETDHTTWQVCVITHLKL